MDGVWMEYLYGTFVFFELDSRNHHLLNMANTIVNVLLISQKKENRRSLE